MTPIVLICGRSGSGKDTVSEAWGGTRIAMADPIKRILIALIANAAEIPFRDVGLDKVLWGDSAARNKPLSERDKKALQWCVDYPGSVRQIAEEVFSEEHRCGLSGSPPAFTEDAAEEVAWFAQKISDRVSFSQVTYRHLLQEIGSCVRESIPDFWIDHAIWTGMNVLAGDRHYSKEDGILKGAGKLDQHSWVTIPDGRYRNEILRTHAIGGSSVLVTRPGESPTPATHHSETGLVDVPRFWYSHIIENNGTLALLKKTVHAVRDGGHDAK